MTNKEAVEVIKSMGLIIDAATSGTRRKSIYLALTLAINALEERPQGEWIKYIRCIECSVCKDKFFAADEEENCQDYEPCTDLRFNFCPNCGAKMTKEAENE